MNLGNLKIDLEAFENVVGKRDHKLEEKHVEEYIRRLLADQPVFRQGAVRFEDDDRDESAFANVRHAEELADKRNAPGSTGDVVDDDGEHKQADTKQGTQGSAQAGSSGLTTGNSGL